jgi:hypothetical protein
MGCNLRLKLAGEQVVHAPPCLDTVIGISQLIDVAAWSTALHMPK